MPTNVHSDRVGSHPVCAGCGSLPIKTVQYTTAVNSGFVSLRWSVAVVSPGVGSPKAQGLAVQQRARPLPSSPPDRCCPLAQLSQPLPRPVERVGKLRSDKGLYIRGCSFR